VLDGWTHDGHGPSATNG